MHFYIETANICTSIMGQYEEVEVTVYTYTCGSCGHHRDKKLSHQNCAKCGTNLCSHCRKYFLCKKCLNLLPDGEMKKVKAVRKKTLSCMYIFLYFGIAMIYIGTLPWGTGDYYPVPIVMYSLGGVLLLFAYPLIGWVFRTIALDKRMKKIVSKLKFTGRGKSA